jgi:hypothetical protein
MKGLIPALAALALTSLAACDRPATSTTTIVKEPAPPAQTTVVTPPPPPPAEAPKPPETTTTTTTKTRIDTPEGTATKRETKTTTTK